MVTVGVKGSTLFGMCDVTLCLLSRGCPATAVVIATAAVAVVHVAECWNAAAWL